MYIKLQATNSNSEYTTIVFFLDDEECGKLRVATEDVQHIVKIIEEGVRYWYPAHDGEFIGSVWECPQEGE